MGPINQARNKTGTVLIKCPIKIANLLADKKKIQMGWTSARVTPVPERRMQCFRCLDFGHVVHECKSDTDRSKKCYRCGGENHIARVCENRAKCMICEAAGAPSEHRMGGLTCDPKRRKKVNNVSTGKRRDVPPAASNVSQSKEVLTDGRLPLESHAKEDTTNKDVLTIGPCVNTSESMEVETLKERVRGDEEQPILASLDPLSSQFDWAEECENSRETTSWLDNTPLMQREATRTDVRPSDDE
ncbi:hypothetical protein ALC62_14802 [Cyphomyrmex costatus]|uniref:CCHC-type domain-containing protein n=1 Tax=Cyphomyrmex costatus TaxID=456900 RepID=A0A151I895_9HYME|nr:hypothetical protein ALC62_14802 [Cyphomyrmex costatus]